jgi:glyoxylase-like metal-dependent hydrolase (beta-lactamase superfamily II)
MSLVKTKDAEIIAVRYGTRNTKKSEVYLNYRSYGEPDAPLVMDYFFWIIRDPQQTIVIDTGFSAASAAQRKRITTITPAAALARLGIDPGEVKLLILTHVHWDHTGNLDLFPNAQILMSRTEYDFIASPFADRPLFAEVMDPHDNEYLLRLAGMGRVTLIEAQDFSLPGIELRELGGHSPGQLSVIVQRPQGPAILSSDAVHYYEELERDRPFVVVSNLFEMYRSLAILRALSAQPGTVLVPGHDPEVMQRFPLVDSNDPGFAVRIV